MEENQEFLDSGIDGEYIEHLFNTSWHYLVNGNMHNGKTFYNLTLKNKKYDGQIEECSYRTEFYDCEPPQLGVRIRIKRAKEGWYLKSKLKYDIVPKIVIYDYEVVAGNYTAQAEAVYEFNKPDYDSDDLPF